MQAWMEAMREVVLGSCMLYPFSPGRISSYLDALGGGERDGAQGLG